MQRASEQAERTASRREDNIVKLHAELAALLGEAKARGCSIAATGAAAFHLRAAILSVTSVLAEAPTPPEMLAVLGDNLLTRGEPAVFGGRTKGRGRKKASSPPPPPLLPAPRTKPGVPKSLWALLRRHDGDPPQTAARKRGAAQQAAAAGDGESAPEGAPEGRRKRQCFPPARFDK
jgi:hypothetical protein